MSGLSVADVERIVDQRLKRLFGSVEWLDGVEHGDAYSLSGDGLKGELDADIAGQYGVYSRPPDGGDALVLKLGGHGNSAVALGFRHRDYEVQIAKGEILIRDDQGQAVHVKRDGIYITADKVVIAGGAAGDLAARKGDKVKVTVPVGTFLTAAQAGVLNVSPIEVEGEIVEGSAKVQIG